MKEKCEKAVYRSRVEYLENENIELMKENELLKRKLFKRSFQHRVKEWMQGNSRGIQRGSVLGWLWTFVMFVPMFLIGPIIHDAENFGKRDKEIWKNFVYALFVVVFFMNSFILLFFEKFCLIHVSFAKVFFISSGTLLCATWLGLCLVSLIEVTSIKSFPIPFLIDREIKKSNNNDKF